MKINGTIEKLFNVSHKRMVLLIKKLLYEIRSFNWSVEHEVKQILLYTHATNNLTELEKLIVLGYP